MSKKLKFAIITSEPFLVFLYGFIRIYAATFRLTVENEKQWLDYIHKGGRVLLCAAGTSSFFLQSGILKNMADTNPAL